MKQSPVIELIFRAIAVLSLACCCIACNGGCPENSHSHNGSCVCDYGYVADSSGNCHPVHSSDGDNEEAPDGDNEETPDGDNEETPDGDNEETPENDEIQEEIEFESDVIDEMPEYPDGDNIEESVSENIDTTDTDTDMEAEEGTPCDCPRFSAGYYCTDVNHAFEGITLFMIGDIIEGECSIPVTAVDWESGISHEEIGRCESGILYLSQGTMEYNVGNVLIRRDNRQWHYNSNLCTPVECSENESRVVDCGLNNRGSIEETCYFERWKSGDCDDPDQCIDNDIRSSSNRCGDVFPGYFDEVCETGQWTLTEICSLSDQCLAGETRPSTVRCGHESSGVYTEEYCDSGEWEVGGECSTDGPFRLVHDRKFNNQYEAENYPRYIRLGDKMLFTHMMADSAESLFVTDGTAAGTYMLMDGNAGPSIVRIEIFPFTTNNHAYFTTRNSLMVTDGTVAGTMALTPENPDQAIDPNTIITALQWKQRAIFFTRNDGVRDTLTFWEINETGTGYHRLPTLPQDATTYADAYNNLGNNVVATQNYIYFHAHSYKVDNEAHLNDSLWRFDGQHFRLLFYGNGIQAIENLVSADDKVFFTVSRYSTSDDELYCLDDHEITPQKVAESLYIHNLTYVPHQNAIYFLEEYEYQHSRLWKSNGTEEGSGIIDLSISLGTRPNLFLIGDMLYITTETISSSVYQFDPRNESTTLLVENFPSYAPHDGCAYKGDAYFFYKRLSGLWKTDGTMEGTHPFPKVKKVLVILGELNDQLIFKAVRTGGAYGGQELWLTDGTNEGTRRIADLNKGGRSSNDALLTYAVSTSDGTLYYTSTVPNDSRDDREKLFYTNGHIDNTHQVEGEFDLVSTAKPVLYNGKIFFSADSSGVNEERLFYVVDTTTNESQVWDIPELTDSDRNYKQPTFLTVCADTLFFCMGYSEIDDNSTVRHNYAIWRSDGTILGTKPDEHIPLAAQGSLACHNSMLYFAAFRETVDGMDLWQYDPQSHQMVMVMEGKGLPEFTTIGENAFFMTYYLPGARGARMAVIEGTQPPRIIDLDYNDYISTNLNMTAADPYIYLWQGYILFAATLYGYTRVEEPHINIREAVGLNESLYYLSYYSSISIPFGLFKATPNGVSPLKTSTPYIEGLYAENLIVFQEKIYFKAFDCRHGNELWVSDGTSVGTRLFKDINPGPGSSNPEKFIVVGDLLYFRANDGFHGQELWVYDPHWDQPPNPAQ